MTSHTTQIQQLDDTTWCLDTWLNRPGHTACYLVRNGDELAFIDCGAATSVPGLLRALESLKLQPEQVRYILPTHVHLDHAGGAGELLAACPNATLATHHKGLPHLVDPSKLQQGAMAVYGTAAFEALFGKLRPAPEARCRALRDGDTLELGNARLGFLDTPGHANHHGCFFDERNGNLYTGDTFGLRYAELDHAQQPFLLATTTPVAFDPDVWSDSLDRMMALAPRRACLTHFGPLETPTRWIKLLRESLEMHVKIALKEESNPEEGRETRLRQALEAEVLARLEQHNPEISRSAARQLLEIDLQLNAQGLTVWLARRARGRR